MCSIWFFYKGVCTNGCPTTINPVCTKSGRQFPNKCFLEKESAALGEGQSLTKLHNGPCAGKDNTSYKNALNFYSSFFFFLLFIILCIHYHMSHKKKTLRWTLTVFYIRSQDLIYSYSFIDSFIVAIDPGFPWSVT